MDPTAEAECLFTLCANRNAGLYHVGNFVAQSLNLRRGLVSPSSWHHVVRCLPLYARFCTEAVASLSPGQDFHLLNCLCLPWRTHKISSSIDVNDASGSASEGAAAWCR